MAREGEGGSLAALSEFCLALELDLYLKVQKQDPDLTLSQGLYSLLVL